ncbi:PREDICTED: uncharacterized protein LOC106807587 [Priapulus caudatus]|uniref:Uncharacterized protein LOC106807587 n=1 Tax=Priapulus caudatus TaxID=37621 RepID=A0ABM1DZT0_PRICU|nr:PREDICTED: uncharacterized protein LOC106807587 [Priapulus caudatus]
MESEMHATAEILWLAEVEYCYQRPALGVIVEELEDSGLEPSWRGSKPDWQALQLAVPKEHGDASGSGPAAAAGVHEAVRVDADCGTAEGAATAAVASRALEPARDRGSSHRSADGDDVFERATVVGASDESLTGGSAPEQRSRYFPGGVNDDAVALHCEPASTGPLCDVTASASDGNVALSQAETTQDSLVSGELFHRTTSPDPNTFSHSSQVSMDDGGMDATAQWPRPRVVKVGRTAEGFGFTLRHFIIYPPESAIHSSLGGAGEEKRDNEARQRRYGQLSDLEPVDTIFVKQVKEEGSAERAGLQTGDRIVAVNTEPVTGKTYAQVIDLIQSCETDLTLLVVPKDVDILQMAYPKSAYMYSRGHDPYTGRATNIPRPPPLYTSHFSPPPFTSQPSPFPAEASVPQPFEESAQPQPARYRSEVTIPSPSSQSAAQVSLSPPKRRHRVSPALLSLGPAPYARQASKIKQSSFFNSPDGRRYQADELEQEMKDHPETGFPTAPSPQNFTTVPPLGSAAPVAIPPHVAGADSNSAASRVFNTQVPMSQSAYPGWDHPAASDAAGVSGSGANEDRTSATAGNGGQAGQRSTPPPRPLGFGSESIRRSQERLKQAAQEHDAAHSVKLRIPPARDVAGVYVKKAVDHLYGKNSLESCRAQEALNLATSDDPAAQQRHAHKYGRSPTAPLLRGRTSFDLRPRHDNAAAPCAPVFSQCPASVAITRSAYPSPYAPAETPPPGGAVAAVAAAPEMRRAPSLRKQVANSASLDSIHTTAGLRQMPSLAELMKTGKLNYNEHSGVGGDDDARYKSDTHLLAVPEPKRLSYTASLSKIHEEIVAQSLEAKPSRPICTPWVQNGVQSGRSAIQAAKRAFLIQAGLLDKESLEPVSPPFTMKGAPAAVQRREAAAAPALQTQHARRQFLGVTVNEDYVPAPLSSSGSWGFASGEAAAAAATKPDTLPAVQVTPPGDGKEKVKPPLRKRMTTPELRVPISRSFTQLDVMPQQSDEERIAALRLVQQRHKQFESGSLDEIAARGKAHTNYKEEAEKVAALSMHNVAYRATLFGLSVEELERIEKQKDKQKRTHDQHQVPKLLVRRASLDLAPSMPNSKQHVEPAPLITITKEIMDAAAEADLLHSTEEERKRTRAVRQNSYLSAVASPYKKVLQRPSLQLVSDHYLYMDELNGGMAQTFEEDEEEIEDEDEDEFMARLMQKRVAGSEPSSDASDPNSDLGIGEPNMETFNLNLSSFAALIQQFDAMLGVEGLPPSSASDTTVTSMASVTLRAKSQELSVEDAEKALRRSSYIMATHSAEDLRKDHTPHKSSSIKKLKAFFGERTPHIVEAASQHEKPSRDLPSPMFDVIKEGYLHLKKFITDGKRASDRSWKPFYVVLRGHALYLYKDKKESAMPPLNYDEPPISIKSAIIDIAHDYTKRKYVFRLTTYNGSEYLLQTEDIPSMMLWIQAIQANSNPDGDDHGVDTAQLIIRKSSLYDGQTRSPQPVQKGSTRRLPFRQKSVSSPSRSPSFKIRKSSSQERDVSPKVKEGSKSWKGKMVKGLKKWSHHGPHSHIEPELAGHTIGVPLEMCPPSANNEFVPLLVDICTTVVEHRGLDVIGVYRIPGNTAAVAHLTDDVNKGLENINLDEQKWKEINVVTSLLKSFFRKLPESMITNDMYPDFLQANRDPDSRQRMLRLKKLIQLLPDHNYETLKHITNHLRNVAANSDKNKMEEKNLAIVFGPTIVRQSGESMMSMVTDMSDQCRIVETLLSHGDWLFNEVDDAMHNDSVPMEVGNTMRMATDTSRPSNLNLLIQNVSKTEALHSPEQEHYIKKDIVSSIISAASRKKIKKKEPAPRQYYVSDDSDMSEIFSERNIDQEIELRQRSRPAGGSGGGGGGSSSARGTAVGQRGALESQSSTDTGVSSWASPPPATPTDSSTKASSRQSSSSFTSTRKGSQSSDVKSPEESSDETSLRSSYSIKWPSPFTRSFTTYHNNKQVASPRARKSSQPDDAVAAAASSITNVILRRQCDDRLKRDAERKKVEKEWQRLKEVLAREDDDGAGGGKYDAFNTNANSNVVEERPPPRRCRADSASDYSTTSSSNNELSTGSEHQLRATTTSRARTNSLDSGASMECVFAGKKSASASPRRPNRALQRSMPHGRDAESQQPAHHGSLDSLCREHHSIRSSASSVSEDGTELLNTASFDQKLKILLDPKYRLGDASLELTGSNRPCRHGVSVPSKSEKTAMNLGKREAQKRKSLSPQLQRKAPNKSCVKRRHTVGGTAWAAVESTYNFNNSKLSDSQEKEKVYINTTHIVVAEARMVPPIREQRSCKYLPQQASVIHLTPQLNMESSV